MYVLDPKPDLQVYRLPYHPCFFTFSYSTVVLLYVGIMKVRDFGPKLSYLQVATSKSPAGFLTSCKVEEKVNEIIRNSKSRVLPWRELKIYFRTLLHICYFWMQYHVETADGQYCIKVARHKSAGKHGPVKLVFSKKILDLMEFYFQNIHNKIVPKKTFQNSFFLKGHWRWVPSLRSLLW